MNHIKNYVFLTALFLIQSVIAQNVQNPTLYRTDFKELSAKNTVTVTSYKKGGKQFVYAGGFGNIDVFSLDSLGLLTSISNHELYMKKGPARGMVADNIQGNDFLFVANKHGDAIETFAIADDGSLERVALKEDTEETHLGTAITLQVIHMKKASYLFVGGLEETPGLSSFRIEKNGELTHIQSMKDDEKIHTDGIIGMYKHKIKGRTYLYTSGFQDNGVSSFKVYESGKFKNVNNIDDNETDRYLTGAYPVTGVQLGGNYYVIVGHRHHKYYKRGNFIKKKDFVYHGDGVSVFKAGRNGALKPHFVLKDDENTKLSGQTRIEIISTKDNEALLAVGTRDNKSIQLCKLTEEGVLSPVNYLETGYSIYYGLNSLTLNKTDYLLAGSFRFGLKKLVAYKIVLEKKENEGKVIRHIVSLKFKETSSEEEVQAALALFENLKNEIPEISALEWGANDSTEGHTKGLEYTFKLTFMMFTDEKFIYLMRNTKLW